MKITKRKRAVKGKQTSDMIRVKDEPISPNDVIGLSDNSNSDESSDESSDSSDSTASSDADKKCKACQYLKVVVKNGNTEFSFKSETKISMKDLEGLYLTIGRIIRQNEISDSSKVIEFQLKKKKRILRKSKKKRLKHKKSNSTKSNNKCNTIDKTEPEIKPKTEILDDNLVKPNSSVWVKPSTSQPENLNSAHTLELSQLNSEIISSDCSNETILLENEDGRGIEMRRNDFSSFKRYEDLNNGDLDYIEATMNINVPIAEELTTENSLKDTTNFSSLNAQKTGQPPVQMIDNDSFHQEIKFEPELMISENEEVFRYIESVTNVPSMEKIKIDPLEMVSETAELNIADKIINNALTDLNTMLIKNEAIEEEPMKYQDDFITLSDEEEDNKKPKIENNCRNKNQIEKFDDNRKNIINHCENQSNDAEIPDEEYLKYHEMQRNELIKAIMSEDEETLCEESFLSDEYSDYAEKKSAMEEKVQTKITSIESDCEMKTINEEATSEHFFATGSNESHFKTDCRKLLPESDKNSDKKKTHIRPKSRQEISAFDEKISYEERKSHKSKRSHDETGAFDEKICGVKKSRSDKKFDDKKKTSQKNTSREKFDVTKIFKDKSEVEKICKNEKLQVEKSCKEKCKEEISDKFYKSENKIKSHERELKRRNSSESKSPKISENTNDVKNENSRGPKTPFNCLLKTCGNPLVVLTKLDDQIKNSSSSESCNPLKDRRDVKNISEGSTDIENNNHKISTPEAKYSGSKSTTKSHRESTYNKSSIKQEAQTPSKKKFDLPDNKRKVSIPEVKCPAIQSSIKTEQDTKKNSQRRKSADIVSIDKLDTNKSIQFQGKTYNEATMKILFEQSQKKVEEIKTLAMNSGVTIVKLQMTMEARENHVDEETEKIAKQENLFKQRSSVAKNFVEKCDSVKEFFEESKQKDKSANMNEKIFPENNEKNDKVKNEKRKSLDADRKESFIDEKVPSLNNRDFHQINAERHKSVDVTNEFVQKSGINSATAEKLSPGQRTFPYNLERKPVTSFVGRIPKKNPCQNNSSPIATTPNCSENNYAQISNDDSSICEKRSPTENESLSKNKIYNSEEVSKNIHQQNTQSIRPLMLNFPPKIPRTLSQFVQQILHWEPSWFKTNDGIAIEKIVGANYMGMKPTYENYDDYYRDAEFLLALKMLDPLTCDQEKFRFPYSIVRGSIHARKIPKTHTKMTILKLDVLVSQNDSMKANFPLDGDLITFTFLTQDELTRTVVENEVFAVIEKVRSEIISDHTFVNPKLRRNVIDPYELRTYTVMTKYIHDPKIHVNRVETMTMIPDSHLNLQNLWSLRNLLHSPLLKYIVHPKVRDYQLSTVFTEYYSLVTKDNLDAQQLDAVARITETAIRRDPKICLIQGPPGTGKTKVVINIVRQLMNRSGKLDRNRPFRILVCAPSNSAVDEIALRLLEERQKIAKDKGERFRMVRVGHSNNISPKVKEISLGELTNKEFERFIDAAMKYDYEKMRKSIQFHSDQDYELRVKKNGAKWYGARNNIARKMEDNKARWDFLKNRKFGTENPLDEEEKDALYRAAESTVLEGAQVVVCTLAGSSKNTMETVFGGTENGFSTCIIDESTKSSEDETLLPLQLGVKTLILVGDTIQQPQSASIMPGETKLHGLDRSLFARLRQVFGEHPENPIIQFQAQYRMSYPVAYWPQQYFYNGELHSCANLRCLPLQRFKVMNLDFSQEDNEGVMNEFEGVFVAELVKILMTRAGLEIFEQPVRIGVITPYHQQKTFIWNQINNTMFLLPSKLKQKIIVDVHTIDGIQGQERDIIIMSCVKTNSTGVLSDKQKVCMALTRAKNTLILCGNFQIYWKDSMWESLLTEAEYRHFYSDISQYTHENEIVAGIVR